jgi:hypothetical protein
MLNELLHIESAANINMWMISTTNAWYLSPFHFSGHPCMMRFLIDNIFEVFGNQIFQQTVGIAMATKCALLIANIFIF